KSAEVKASVHKDVTKPSRPTDVTVTSSSAASVAVTWTASTDDTGVVSYTISRNGTKLSQVSGSTASFVDVAVQPGTTYTYTVAANDAAGNASDASAAGSVTTPSGSAPAADTTAPSAPAGLIAKAKSGTEIDLSWTASTDNVAVAGYKVYRDGAVVATVGSTSWFDTGLAAGGEYSYEVSAVDAAGNESAKTSPVKQTTAKDSTAPSAPANLSATATAWNEVTLTWAASTDDVGVASYNIKRGGETIARVSGPTLTFVDHTTTIQTEYKYTVTATDAANNSSAPSNEVAVTTPVWKSCVTTTTPVDPVADSYVNQASPATNYGTETKLVALGTSETVYLKFDLTNLPAGQITGATLRLYSTTASSSGYTVASVEDTSWGEVHWVPTTIQDRTGTDLDLYEVPLEGKGITQLALLQDSEPTTGQPCIFIDPVTNTQVKIFVNSVELSRVWQFHINMDNFATAAGWADSITTGAVTNDSLGGMLIGNGFLRFFFNTVIIAVLGTIGATLSAIIVAYGFARFRIPGRDALFLVLIGTILLPFQVTLIPQFIIFHAIGWAGTWYPLIVPHYFSNAYNVFLLRQYFLTLPRELDEAAMMDGASPFRVLISIIIPQSWPAIAAVMLFHFFFAWNDFLGPLIYLTGKPDLYPIAIGLNYFNTTFRVNNAPPAIQAGALLSLILPVVIFFFAQRVFMRGVVISGVEK
ncbi:MAG: ABC transporter permease subunit, partial [Candidatus Limnocylindrales bacterium]